MLTELIEELKRKVMMGETTISDMDVLNTIEEEYNSVCERLEMFMNKGLDESEALMSQEGEINTKGIHIENVVINIYHEKQKEL